MELIWQKASDNGVTVRDIYEVLRLKRPIAYTTVMTTMARLAKKKLLRIRKREQTYYYFPQFSVDEFKANLVGRVLDSLLVEFSGQAMSHLTRLAGEGEAETIARIMEQIAERRSERKAKDAQ
ncbi:MAG: BlaI/MecI/CopY family transcriptional regulator [Chloroflexi bacterium]|nr:BlaI/MecI/CopY family transcriptional regulator [Chloroflexota bacterium]